MISKMENHSKIFIIIWGLVIHVPSAIWEFALQFLGNCTITFKHFAGYLNKQHGQKKKDFKFHPVDSSNLEISHCLDTHSAIQPLNSHWPTITLYWPTPWGAISQSSPLSPCIRSNWKYQWPPSLPVIIVTVAHRCHSQLARVNLSMTDEHWRRDE